MNGKRWDIQVLRALAVIAVILYHAHVPWIHGGSFGVDIFFVISGYLITTGLLRSSGSTLDFYRRRLLRTAPAALVALVVMAGVVFLVTPGKWDTISWSVVAAATWSVNVFVTAIDLHWARAEVLTPFTHYWSLALEEQFYLLWPAVLAAGAFLARRILIPSRWILAVVVGITGAASLWLYVSTNEAFHVLSYFSPMTRYWELAVGALLALIPAAALSGRVARLPKTAVAVALLTGLAVLSTPLFLGDYSDPGNWPGWAVMAVTGTALVVAFGSRLSGEPIRLLVPVLWVGTVSYGLYLWHWPVMWLMYEKNASPENSLFWLVVALVVSGLLAWGSWRLIEQPGIRLARRAGRRSVPAVVGGPSVDKIPAGSGQHSRVLVSAGR